MDTRYKPLLAVAVAAGLANAASNVIHAAVVTTAGFTFETSANPGPFPSGTATAAGPITITTFGAVTAASLGGFVAEIGTGTAFGTHASTATAWSTPVGNGSLHSLSSNGWSSPNTDYYQFNVSAAGIQNIIVAYNQTGSNTGPGVFALDYSTDQVNFTNFTNYTITTSTPGWSSGATSTSPQQVYSFDLSAITDLNNDPSIAFRVRLGNATQAISSAAIGTAGTGRIDNFFVSGNEIPEPASLTLVTAATSMLLAGKRRSK